MKLKQRKRKVPVTAPLRSSYSSIIGKTHSQPVPDGIASTCGPSSSSSSSSSSSPHPRVAAKLIRRFHVLMKRRAQLVRRVAQMRTKKQDGPSLSSVESSTDSAVGEIAVGDECARVEADLVSVNDEIAALGGLDAYQRVSRVGQAAERGGGSEKVLVEWLRELGLHVRNVKGKEREMGKEKLRLLEVGALFPDNYAACSAWIEAHPIDLHSSHLGIEEQDFLLIDQTEQADAWDVISLSLVLNFVPNPEDRGKMLRYAHNMLRDGGYLFLVLPLPCIQNSRYLTFEHMACLMAAIGFDSIRERWKTRGKMIYWLFAKRGASRGDRSLDDGAVRLDKKIILREGNRNNFCILI